MVDGPHVMIILPDEQHFTAVPAEHDGARAYVMWKGTAYAHIMMPVGERPRQRDVVRRQACAGWPCRRCGTPRLF